ncbi:L-glutamate gamma-semialdehyde dehydrogenase [Fuerstiella marisgermanici]|uniref:L-glutamate gamma-semialdehyde dehydrogenase n=1 Tax=Fuerstiella marisgermanici TaxID=1891926 RepID=A0A1P8WRH7_9PLAN|nr:L-glutamate gamma-semialdehyde dehydrogenase [Fuerstiella marisgermanici]APZ96655.1 1-pyrroline-5-carboxylate dehydrogenase [Fuerstiella marisgermanici]
MAKRVRIEDRVEQRTQEIGEDLFGRLNSRSSSIFHGRWWEDRLMNWAMEDEAVKVQMFRFVDVLPMLRTHTSIAEHLDEYFEDVKSHLPWAARIGLDLSTNNSILSRALAYNARTNAARMARRFIAGENAGEVLKSVQQLRKNGLAFTLDLLGEAIISDVEADRYQQQYLDLIAGMSEQVDGWSEVAIIDHDHNGAIPRLNVSLKLSALDSQFSPIDHAGTRDRVLHRLRPILRAAQEHSAYVHFDMEQYDYKELTLDIFQHVLMEDEFREFADAGIVVQAYLEDAGEDLKRLLAWTKKRGTAITIRLVKGAYWDYETIRSEYRNWPCPVFRRKWQSDDSFEQHCRFLMKNYEWLRPALASHNLRSLAHGLAWAEEYKVPQRAVEVQMLYGMSDQQAQLFTERGHRVRVYTPFGELIPGMAYLVRRLLENTSNDSFLRQSFTEHVAVEKLLMKPSDHAVAEPPIEDEPAAGFQNEPLTDFSIEANRTAMQEALDFVRSEFGQTYPLVIDGKSSESRSTLSSRNPSDISDVIGHVAAASADQAADAVDAAHRAFPQWAAMETSNRCEYLELIAAEMRERRFELAAWICFEVGKPWAEADGDVAEAIDFCMYYAHEMRRLDEPQQCDFKGEENSYSYRPRGVAVVIAPWNFPLAILTGMTTAAIVTGNTVVMKPAEQSSVVGAKLMEIIRNAGVPDGVVNFLPGIGEDVGPELIASPDVDMVCFTGSQTVGLEINRVASDTDERQTSVRHVIAEMGGKNAIIVDADADLDEAVVGVMHSAFGYAGQKCSACSRVIVLEGAYDQFIERLIEATKSLKIGAAEDPSTKVGPVIDDDAKQRILAAIKTVDAEVGEEVALSIDTKTLDKQGTFVGPHIITGVDPDSNLAQDEIFGPVLSVMKVRNLDEAFTVANNTRYALTGGVYSRSPSTLKRARNEFEVGNLYLNREITGAIVQRQPFGGFRMSGIGTKAGGPDYLLQFMVPINVTENTMRRGFAPPPNDDA